MELFPLLGFIEIKTVLLIGHVLGVALGAGVAFFSAAMFTKVMYDGKVTPNEYQFLELAGTLVAIGLTILVITGLGMFLLDSERYLASTKFISKMTIIGILIVNGTLIHALHMPVLKKNIGKDLLSLKEFKIRSTLMYMGGAVSMTSWFSAVALGVFRSIPYSYPTIMTVYALILVVALTLALIFKSVLYAKNSSR